MMYYLLINNSTKLVSHDLKDLGHTLANLGLIQHHTPVSLHTCLFRTDQRGECGRDAFLSDKQFAVVWNSAVNRLEVLKRGN